MHSKYHGNRCYLTLCKFLESFKVNMVSRKVQNFSQTSIQEPAVYAIRKKKDVIQSLFLQLQDSLACFLELQIFTFLLEQQTDCTQICPAFCVSFCFSLIKNKHYLNWNRVNLGRPLGFGKLKNYPCDGEKEAT